MPITVTGQTVESSLGLSAASAAVAVRAVVTSLAAFTRTGNVIIADAAGVIGAQDGVTLVVGDVVLLSNLYATGGAETPTAADSGIYTVTNVGAVDDDFILTRHGSLDSDADLALWIATGTEAVVKSGTVNGAKGWHFRIPPNSTATTLNTDGIVIPRYAPNAPRYMSGAMPAWQSVTNVRIASGSEWVDQDTGAVIVAPSDLDINIGAAIGPLGIDTGAEAIST